MENFILQFVICYSMITKKQIEDETYEEDYRITYVDFGHGYCFRL